MMHRQASFRSFHFLSSSCGQAPGSQRVRWKCSGASSGAFVAAPFAMGLDCAKVVLNVHAAQLNCCGFLMFCTAYAPRSSVVLQKFQERFVQERSLRSKFSSAFQL